MLHAFEEMNNISNHEHRSREGSDLFLEVDEWHEICSELCLSPRETEIAEQILLGQREMSIAENLSISSHTVHSHIERLYRKLNVHSRCALVSAFFRLYVCMQNPDSNVEELDGAR
ncbi:MAG: response regulator transcription factor [Woeseiaceae bacterium]